MNRLFDTVLDTYKEFFDVIEPDIKDISETAGRNIPMTAEETQQWLTTSETGKLLGVSHLFTNTNNTSNSSNNINNNNNSNNDGYQE